MKKNRLMNSMLCASLLWGGLPGAALTQSMPGSTVWLVQVSRDGELKQPFRISRAQGYDNQPHFAPDGNRVYFTSEGENAQTDIRVFDMDEQRLDLVNSAAESDYSPTPIPGQQALSMVRVESDGRQRLWRVDLDSGEESLLLSDIEPVGYHEWISENMVALFILGETFDLFAKRLGQGESHRVHQNIGRTLRMDARTGALLFVDKNTTPWSIAAMDPSTLKVRQVLQLFPDVEDFEIDAEGRIWSGVGSKLYVSEENSTEWRLTADLSEFGIQGITRLAASPDARWLAVVSSP
jgi:tricorn protease-like protein